MKHRALVAVAAVVGSLAAAVPGTACTCARDPEAPPKGVSYPVYASHHDDRPSTGICYPTKALADAAAEVAVLAELVRPAPEVRDDAPVVAGLDHVPVAVADLEAAAERYRRLGFTLKPGRPHDNGIENRHVKFADGTEIELITASEARDSLTAEYVRHLASGDGPAFLALYAPDLDRLARRFDAAPRPYRRSSHGTLSFPDEDPLGYVFFGPRNASPTDLPAHFEHANGADSLIAVWLAGDDLSAEREMLARVGATLAEVEVLVPDAVRATVARLEEGEVVLLPGSRQLVAGRRIVGATLRTRSLSAARDALREGGLEIPATVTTEDGTSIFLPPDVTHGIWLELREPRDEERRGVHGLQENRRSWETAARPPAHRGREPRGRRRPGHRSRGDHPACPPALRDSVTGKEKEKTDEPSRVMRIASR